MKKRVLSLLLVFVMVLGLLPSGALRVRCGGGQGDDGRYILTADIGLSEWTADFSGSLMAMVIPSPTPLMDAIPSRLAAGP